MSIRLLTFEATIMIAKNLPHICSRLSFWPSLHSCSIRSKSEHLLSLWANLEVLSADKGSKLQESSEEQQFLRSVSDFDLWIDEVEKALASEDLGKVKQGISNNFVATDSYIIMYQK